MYPYTHLPPPLFPQEFYVLLALSRGDLHGYALKAVTTNDSLGSIKMAAGTFYPLIKRMTHHGLIQESGPHPAGKSGQDRIHYRLTDEGNDRLKEELDRLQYAVKIGEAGGYFNDQLPPDIQRILRELKA